MEMLAKEKLHHAVKEAQALMARYNLDRVFLSQEIIADRQNKWSSQSNQRSKPCQATVSVKIL
jgi:enamine deaminase RidA (YjgF/YER057c/UK114 family)